ncbi:hypothetical protein Ahy_A06g030094 [Arachis hypogaea]|uniref:Uncharacterized protein n=1 Tax=Arachis hypogaea TaxID=3818 RepID=A0A445CV74_ARAHY|nr:hypothetical protein Ahy_A06g030094 [Arachis hypogaea]
MSTFFSCDGGDIGKLVRAFGPRNLIAALSYSLAASSAVSKVPSQTRMCRFGSRISAAHLPHGLCLTPRYFLPLLLLLVVVVVGVVAAATVVFTGRRHEGEDIPASLFRELVTVSQGG